MTPFSFSTFAHVDEAACFGGPRGMVCEEFTTIDVSRNKIANRMRHAILRVEEQCSFPKMRKLENTTKLWYVFLAVRGH